MIRVYKESKAKTYDNLPSTTNFKFFEGEYTSAIGNGEIYYLCPFCSKWVKGSPDTIEEDGEIDQYCANCGEQI